MSENKKQSISMQSAELAEAVPRVVLNRLSQMAKAGTQPSLEDVIEFNRMWFEKIWAAAASWSEINKESLRYQQIVIEATTSFWSAPWMMPHAFVASSMIYGSDSVKRILSNGLAPVHKIALENAERLNREANS